MHVKNRPAAYTIEAILLAAFFSVLFLYAFHPNWDIDIFWQMEAGEWISEHGELPQTDIFTSVDKTRPWTTFQWLYEVITYQTNARLGFGAVRLMHALLYLAAFAIFYLTYRRRLSSRSMAFALLLLSLVLSEDRFRVRPEAFNFFFTALILPILLDITTSTTRRPGTGRLVLTGTIAFLWANIHAGGALTLLVGAGAMFGGSLMVFALRRDRETTDRLIHSAWILAVAAIPMLISPNFIKGNLQAFTMVNHSRLLIPEWHPPAAYFMPSMGGKLTVHTFLCGTVPYIVLGWAMLANGLGLVRMLGDRLKKSESPIKIDMGLLVTALFFAVIAAQSSRFVYASAFAVLLLLWNMRERLVGPRDNASVRMVLMLVTVLLALASFQYSVGEKKGGLKGQIELLKKDNEPNRFPKAASDTIAAMGLKGRIFHFTSWGGYLVYRHFPECDIFTDGRGNFSLEERDVLIETHRPWDREKSLEKAWSKYPFEILVFPRPVFPMLTWDRSKWMLIYRDKMAEVFLRVCPENRENIVRALDWWKVTGTTTTDDPIAFQETYRRIKGRIALEDEKITTKLINAAQMSAIDSLAYRVTGLHDGALILFGVGLHERSIKFFKMILDEDIRHSTAALYLAWARYLGGDIEGARKTQMQNFGSRDILMKPDRGPLKRSGQRILDELGLRTGLKKIAPAPVTPR